ncbi:9ba76f0a-b210-4479-a94d-af74db8261e0 [Thermothielavioides terrestris]|uniref:9ba76f0a-b210-4479-a94d-af74db8261e0 n=1 Tax=Thermothielavioides terrestris TaxID=2587410 RepID=A0A446BMG7_9PEZI|nr:9ba76f0a-b210-4479-a94d-af74db8261e0 [Thermothielavioides terrestris]
MAASVESPQFERDLRSARKEWKRTKDSAVKWSHGRRHLAGIRVNILGEAINPADAPDKFRPGKKYSDFGHPLSKPKTNLVKINSLSADLPSSRKRAKIHALAEIEAASRGDLSSQLPNAPTTAGSHPSPSLVRSLSASADSGVLYSFDRADTPGRPLTLEVFVKKTTARETERLVEREYEVLDATGEAVKGRRARALLRRAETGAAEGEGKGGGGPDGGEGVEDEEGFELV